MRTKRKGFYTYGFLLIKKMKKAIAIGVFVFLVCITSVSADLVINGVVYGDGSEGTAFFQDGVIGGPGYPTIENINTYKHAFVFKGNTANSSIVVTNQNLGIMRMMVDDSKTLLSFDDAGDGLQSIMGINCEAGACVETIWQFNGGHTQLDMLPGGYKTMTFNVDDPTDPTASDPSMAGIYLDSATDTTWLFGATGVKIPSGNLNVTFNATANDFCTHSGTCLSSVSGGSGGWTDDGTIVRLTTSTDQVGIGTSSSKSKFDIVSASNSYSDIDDGDGGHLRVGAGTSSTDDALFFGVHTGDYSWVQAIDPGASYRDLALNPSGGDVGIGTTSPDAKLDVAGAIVSGTAIITANTNNYDVSGINTLFCNTENNDITIGGLSGGVDGQNLHIIKYHNTHTLTIEFDQTGASESNRIWTGTLNDLVLLYPGFGGYTLVYSGTANKWFTLDPQ